MAISKEKKGQLQAGYVKSLAESQAVILSEYQGMSVAAATALRVRLREAGASFHIVKNTLFRAVLERAGIPDPGDMLKGPVGICYCGTDVAAAVKALNSFARENEQLRIRGGIVGTSLVDAAGAKALADLPPREVLLAQLVGTVQGPMSSLAGVLAAPLRDLVYVLQARSEQEQKAAA
ncbi:MAG TPA: 50S ribosomal protein L10 [Anaerolineae bacterium]|nr:50S ribosomal protein L10 [Anaerolineae bacterium]